MSSEPIVVWGVGTPRTMRAHWVLQELALPYETRAIGSRTGETQSDDFLALNPRGKIPVLQLGDRRIDLLLHDARSAALGIAGELLHPHQIDDRPKITLGADRYDQ